MKLGSRDDFSELFHIRWLDVDNVETLILDVEVPQIDAEVVTTYERLPIAIDGYAVYVVGMSICVISARNSGDDGIVVSQSGELEGRCVAKGDIGIRSWGTTTTAQGSTGCQIM